MKKIILLMLISISTAFSQVKVSTLSGTTSASIYLTNNGYNNGAGNLSTYQMPLGVAVDSNGNIIAYDDYINVLRKIDPTGFTSQFCGNGNFISPSFVSGFVDGAPNIALFTNITAITIDKHDNIYLIDYNRLRKVTSQGIVSTIISSQTEFKDAEGICIDDASGNIFISDTGNKRIRKVTANGTITTIALGFTNPKGICLDLQGNLCVSDVTIIKKVTQTGVITNYSSGYNALNGICMDTAGNLYVCDSSVSQIKKVDTSGVTTVYAGNDYSDFRDGYSGSLRISARFNNPQGIAIDSAGNLYVADKFNERIRKISKI